MFFVHQMIQMRQPNIMLKRNAMASPVPKHVARVNVKSHRTSNILSQDRAKIYQRNKWIDSRQRTSKEPHASPKVKKSIQDAEKLLELSQLNSGLVESGHLSSVAAPVQNC